MDRTELLRLIRNAAAMAQDMTRSPSAVVVVLQAIELQLLASDEDDLRSRLDTTVVHAMDRDQALLRVKEVIANLKDPAERVSAALVLLHELAEDLRNERPAEDPAKAGFRDLAEDLQSRLDAVVAQRDEAIAAADGAMAENLKLLGELADLKDRLAAAVKLSGAHRTECFRLQAEVDTLKAELSHATAHRERKVVAGVVHVEDLDHRDRLGKLEYAVKCYAERIVKLENVQGLHAARLDKATDSLANLEHNVEVGRQRIDGIDRTLTLQFGDFNTSLRERPRPAQGRPTTGRVAD